MPWSASTTTMMARICPLGAMPTRTLDYLDGDLYVRFQLARPRDTDDDFDASTWLWMGHLLPFIDPQQFYTSYLKDKQFKDQIFIEQLGAQIAETFAQQMRIFAVRDDNSEVELPIDATLLSNFANNTPAYISLRLAAGLPPVRRAEIKFIKISGTSRLGPFLISLLPANSRVIVESGTIAYRTRYSSDYLFQNARIQNDIKTSDDVRIFTPSQPAGAAQPAPGRPRAGPQPARSPQREHRAIPPYPVALDEQRAALHAP